LTFYNPFVFSNGFIRYAAVLPLGGNLLTKDISYLLKTPLAEAERAKTLNGAAFLSAGDEQVKISLPLIGEEAEGVTTTVSRQTLISIMLARIEQIFGFLRTHLMAEEKEDLATRRIILCGGVSQTAGLQDKAKELLDAQIRLGKPVYINGLSNVLPLTTLSTVIGLLLYALNYRIKNEDKKRKLQSEKTTWFKKVVKWMIQSF